MEASEALVDSDAYLHTVYAEFEKCNALRGQLQCQMAELRAKVRGDLDAGEWLLADVFETTDDRSPHALVAEFLDRTAREDEELDRLGYFEIQARANLALDCAGRLANRIFAAKARSLSGVLVKYAILRRAMGSRGAQEDGDEQLEAFQDQAPTMWLDSLGRDIERLAGYAVAATFQDCHGAPLAIGSKG
ncbi:hypothetical protein DRB17_05765 [Ferruginivarius sediminum]|uniref:Uncharacterized protein n=1 Tax=Ferruginivarius sediminum TaxID=2661937 RepID=A0A369TBL9_9PROT|nr:hypothetical protein DRB17_05765 [Ferruginivarius sediminum]